MNHETVLELYEIAQEWSYEKYSKKETGYTREYWAAYKLAELIVRECVTSIEKTIDTTCDTDSEKMGCEFAITDILEHFGVEE